MTRISGEWIEDTEIKSLFSAAEASGHQMYFVGGCVRDAILGRAISDIDVATSATPEAVIELAENLNLRTIPTGIDHGTVTIVTLDGSVEVTTFRRDVETDGRHAKTVFSTSLEEDAKRRDLTINALYADGLGQVVDPVGGLEDLKHKRVRFIGDPVARIREDYLRILRFFRFFAWYGSPETGIDPDGLSACASEQAGIDTLSAERIGAEMKKLLSAPDPSPAVAAMAQSGVLARVLPGSDPKALAPLVHLEEDAGSSWLRRAASLGGEGITERWRLSRAEAKSFARIKDAISGSAQAPELSYRLGHDEAQSVMLLRAALLEAPLPKDLARDLSGGASAEFPISAEDLMPDLEGKALGEALTRIEQKWIDSGFSLDRDALLHWFKTRP